MADKLACEVVAAFGWDPSTRTFGQGPCRNSATAQFEGKNVCVPHLRVLKYRQLNAEVLAVLVEAKAKPQEGEAELSQRQIRCIAEAIAPFLRNNFGRSR